MKVNKYGIEEKHMRRIQSISEDEETITIVFRKNATEERSSPAQKQKYKPGNVERRTYTANIQLRAAEGENGEQKESRTVEGYAAVFNTETDIGWWRESIAPGAFDDVLNDDVRALFNHDPNKILARTNNTLEIWQDEKGLGYRFEAPNTTAGNDLLEDLRIGNVTQSSFGFTIDGYEWEEREDGTEIFTITKIGRLFDVSPVTFPAYETTEATARSIEALRKEHEKRQAEEGETGPDDTGEEGEDDATGPDAKSEELPSLGVFKEIAEQEVFEHELEQ